MSKRKKVPSIVANRLRKAIDDSELSQNEIARRAEMDPAMVNKFLHGARDMTLGRAERLAKVLGLELKVLRKVIARKYR